MHTRTRVDACTDPRSISRSLPGRREYKGKKREYRRRSNGLRSGLPSFIFPTDPSLAIRSVLLLPALDPPSHACTRACECKKGEGVIIVPALPPIFSFSTLTDLGLGLTSAVAPVAVVTASKVLSPEQTGVS